MDVHFADKLGVAATSMEHAPKIKCQVTKRVLYGIPKYHAEVETRQADNKYQHMRTVSAGKEKAKAKGAKKGLLRDAPAAEADPAAKKAKAAPKPKQALKGAIKTKHGKSMKLLEESLEAVTTAIGQVQHEKAKDHFAPSLENKLKMAKASLDDSAAVLGGMVSSEYAGNSEDITKDISEASSRAVVAGKLVAKVDDVMEELEEDLFGDE